jgi:hypothetical protein
MLSVTGESSPLLTERVSNTRSPQLPMRVLLKFQDITTNSEICNCAGSILCLFRSSYYIREQNHTLKRSSWLEPSRESNTRAVEGVGPDWRQF